MNGSAEPRDDERHHGARRVAGVAPAWVQRLRWFNTSCVLFASVLLVISRMDARVPPSICLGVPLLALQLGVGLLAPALCATRDWRAAGHRRPLVLFALGGSLVTVAALVVAWTGEWGC